MLKKVGYGVWLHIQQRYECQEQWQFLHSEIIQDLFESDAEIIIVGAVKQKPRQLPAEYERDHCFACSLVTNNPARDDPDYSQLVIDRLLPELRKAVKMVFDEVILMFRLQLKKQDVLFTMAGREE